MEISRKVKIFLFSKNSEFPFYKEIDGIKNSVTGKYKEVDGSILVEVEERYFFNLLSTKAWYSESWFNFYEEVCYDCKVNSKIKVAEDIMM